MLISHEIPKQLFPYEGLINDYPYVLGHLLKKDPEYAAFYKEKLKSAPYSILDNSAFELGESIPMEELYELGKEYKPTHLVLPDKVNDYHVTLSNAASYLGTYREDDQKYIGVCQGESFDQIFDCVEFYTQNKVDIIALPFDLIPDSDHITVRYRFLNWMLHEKHIPLGIKIHLLGCQNPVEFQLFKTPGIVKSFIHSLDTSSPVVNGWVGNELGPHGLTKPKPKAKLADNLDITLTQDQIDLITKNVKTFRNYVRNS